MKIKAAGTETEQTFRKFCTAKIDTIRSYVRVKILNNTYHIHVFGK